MAITLPKDTEAFLLGSLKRYARENLDLELGDLAAKLLLEFVVKEVGPSVYNQAVADAQAAMQAKVEDLPLDCYQAEFTYWKHP